MAFTRIFENGDIIAVQDDDLSGVNLSATAVTDHEGTYLEHPVKVTVRMDNYQMWELALELLKMVDANDTRGST